MTRFVPRALAALILGLAIAGSADALTVSPRQPTLALDASGAAVAKFDIDFGADATAFAAFQIDLVFDTGVLATSLDGITLNFDGAAPDFGLGEFSNALNANGATLSWITAGGPQFPVAPRLGVLNVPLTSKGLAGSTGLQVDMLWSDADFNDMAGHAAMTIAASPVPEPQSWALALCGAGLLLALRRRAES